MASKPSSAAPARSRRSGQDWSRLSISSLASALDFYSRQSTLCRLPTTASMTLLRETTAHIPPRQDGIQQPAWAHLSRANLQGCWQIRRELQSPAAEGLQTRANPELLYPARTNARLDFLSRKIL